MSSDAAPSSTVSGVAPRSSARWLASWIVLPSMIGSENGIPISIASAPASATARTTSHHCAPSPPVTYGTSNLRPASRRSRRTDSSFIASSELTEPLGHLRGVLVAAARQREQHRRALRHRLAGLAREPADRVRGFERGHDALGLGKELETGERLLVGGDLVAGPALLREHRVLRADTR